MEASTQSVGGLQAFRYVLLYLRAVAHEASSTAPSASTSNAAARAAKSLPLPAAASDLTILLAEAEHYELPELESQVAAALKATPTQCITHNGAVSASTTAAGVVDDTTDIYSKASRMQLEFQSVYVTISSPNGLQFTEKERQAAMAEVNARTTELQTSGFRVKAMNTGVAQDRKTKDYCMCAAPGLPLTRCVVQPLAHCAPCGGLGCHIWRRSRACGLCVDQVRPSSIAVKAADLRPSSAGTSMRCWSGVRASACPAPMESPRGSCRPSRTCSLTRRA